MLSTSWWPYYWPVWLTAAISLNTLSILPSPIKFVCDVFALGSSVVAARIFDNSAATLVGACTALVPLWLSICELVIITTFDYLIYDLVARAALFYKKRSPFSFRALRGSMAPARATDLRVTGPEPGGARLFLAECICVVNRLWLLSPNADLLIVTTWPWMDYEC